MTLGRGRDYFERGTVRLAETAPERVLAVVQGTRRHTVGLRFKGQKVLCPLRRSVSSENVQLPLRGNCLADWPLANLHGEATVISFTSHSEFFKGKTETFAVMRFFLELTQHIPPKGCQHIRRCAPVCFSHQREMAGQAPGGAARSSRVEEGATAG